MEKKDYELADNLGLEWYVLCHNFNNDTIERFNIFNSLNFLYGVTKSLKKYEGYEKFVEDIKGWLMYSFWSKSEYEIMCSGLFSKDNCYKIDIYFQTEKNVDLICKYILTEYNKTRRKKLEF